MSWQPNKLEQARLDKLAKLQEAGVEAYPLRSTRTHTLDEAIAAFEVDETASVAVTVCGRLVSVRDKGKSVFAHVEDENGRLQLFVRRDAIGEEAHMTFRKLLDLGDFIQVSGEMTRTRAGEVTLRVSEYVLLAKAITPLPMGKEQEVDGEMVRYSGFSDVEERYRQRYADLAVNRDVRDVFRTRSKIVSSMRRFLDDNGFLEVETPILQPLYGGAAARPFTTHHNQLKQDLYLRIAFELYLKRLLVGGFERVYEIGRDFRNEGVSFKHNPEFTQMEFYAAYWDYNDVMDFIERMYVAMTQATHGTQKITYQGHELDFGKPWARITLRDAIKEHSGIDYMEHQSADSLAKAIVAIGGYVPKDASWGRLVDTLLGDYVEPHLTQPTFITEYPRDISPLAKGIPDDPFHVERFEYFIAGMEMGNAFSELNDPIEQQKRFEDMQALYKSDDDEAHPIDEDYLRAMRYGMPPNGGFGTGIDRITMLLTDNTTIREVLLFPHLREREE